MVVVLLDMTITKLFAVVALSACEMASPEPPVHNTAAVVPNPEPAVAPPTAQPRTLRNGRPACGNVASRSASVRRCK